MSNRALVLCVNRMIFLLSKVRYPLFNEIPNTWPLIIKPLEEYAHLTCCKMKTWKLHSLESTKCNTDRCSQLENPCLSALTLLLGMMNVISYMLKHRKSENFLLITKKIFDVVWEVPWIFSMDVRNITFSMHNRNVKVFHTFKEGDWY